MTIEPYAYIGATGLMGALLCLFLWVAPPSPRRTAVALLTANVIAWLVGEVLVILSVSVREAELAVRGTYVFIALIPLTFHHLVQALDETSAPRHRLTAAATTVFAGMSLGLLLFSSLIIVGARSEAWGYHRISGPLFPLFSVVLFVGLTADLALLAYAARRATDPLKRLRCQHMLVWLGINVAIGLLNLGVLQPLGLHRYRMFIVPLGVTLTCAAVIHATARARLVDVPTALRRTVVSTAMVATLLVPCLGISFLAELVMTGTVALGPSVVTAVLFCVAGFGFPRLRVSAEHTLEQALFGARANDRRLLLSASGEVTSVLSLSTLASVTRGIISRAFPDTDAMLWMRHDEKLVAVDREDVKAEAAPVIAWANRAPGPAVLSDDGSDAAFQGWREAGVEVAVPLRVKNRTVGLLTLAHRTGGHVYTDDDVALIATLGNHVAIALENARLYEELQESREQVNHASRLSAVGTLAAGIAHEIRNPLVAVKTFLELLPSRMDDPSFVRNFRELSLGEVERITRLITDLLSFARSHERRLAAVDVAGIANHVAGLLRPEATKAGVEVTVVATDALPAVQGDADQIRQALLNVVLNGIQATPSGGTVTIRVEPGRSLSGEAQVRVQVVDQGPGIPLENREAIFTPFFTTKAAGTGLGLAVTHQIVVEHGGTLSAGSAPGGGASFLFTFPLWVAGGAATRAA